MGDEFSIEKNKTNNMHIWALLMLIGAAQGCFGGGGGGGGSAFIALKQLFVEGLRGVLKIGQIFVNVFCKRFARGASAQQ